MTAKVSETRDVVLDQIKYLYDTSLHDHHENYSSALWNDACKSVANDFKEAGLETSAEYALSQMV